MRCGDSELEKKIEDILNSLDSLEIEKEPLSKCSEHFFGYIKKKMDSADGKVIRENPMIFMCKYEDFQNRYDTGMKTRIQEWKKISEKKLSELLKNEIGMENEDIELAKKPFRNLMIGSGFLNQISTTFDSFGINFFVFQGNKKLSMYNFFNRMKYNKCAEISMLYNLSIEAFVDIAEMRVASSGKESIGNQLFELVHLPLLKKDGDINEGEERQNFKEFLESERRLCDIEIDKAKHVLIRNIKDIDNEYSMIKRENISLGEYLKGELWA